MVRGVGKAKRAIRYVLDMGWFTTFARSPRYLGQVSVLVPCAAVFLLSRIAAWFPVVGSALSLAIALALPMAVLRRTASGDDELSVDVTAIEPRIAGWFGPLLRLAMALAMRWAQPSPLARWSSGGPPRTSPCPRGRSSARPSWSLPRSVAAS